MEASVFAEISLILVVATVVAGLTQLLRQPLIIGHIITGVLVGPSLFNLVRSTETIEVFSHIGIALLLFIIGLGLNPKVIKEVGKVALITGLGQILFTSTIGFGLASLMGFAFVPAMYIAIAITFSSTIIILKLLSDKKEQNRLYGKIATGFLLVQDIVAVLLLVFLSTMSAGGASTGVVLATVLKGALLAGGIGVVAVYLLPRLTEFFAHSQEFLFLFSIGWGLGIASLFAWTGFSIEIGALAAGVALAGTAYTHEISSRMRPLRDFFIILFFVVLGAGLSFENTSIALLPALALSLFVLVGNPVIVMTLMGFLGYTRKTSFKAGLTVAQISEFSLILVLLGSRLGQVSQDVLSIITLVGIITIAGSTYMMLYDDELFKVFSPILKIFERKKVKTERKDEQAYDVILFGYKSGGQGYLKAISKLGRSYLVVDYDPESIDELSGRGIASKYGDANDSEFLDSLNFKRAKLVIINLANHSTNSIIIDRVRAASPRTLVLATAETDDIEKAIELYDRGASYVLMPRFLGSVKLKSLVRGKEIKNAKFRQEREKHKQFLRSVISE